MAENKTNWLGTSVKNHSYVLVFLLILVVYGITISLTGKQFSVGHVSSILSAQNTVIVGSMAIGMALVIITGQIDLSVGSALVLTSGVTACVFNMTGNPLLTLLSALACGALLGAFNGVLAAYANIPPFIVTLGTMLIYRSLALWAVREIPQEITGSGSSQFALSRDQEAYEAMRNVFGTGSIKILGFPISFTTILFVLLIALFVVICQKTKYGKAVYAVGSNAKAAGLAGIRVKRIQASVFIVTGLLVGIASFIQVCKIGNITPASSGRSFEMYAIAAVVLGGIAMAGGRGNMLGVLFGALSYTAIDIIIVSIPALSVDIQDTFQGLVLILVILMQSAGPILRQKFARLPRVAVRAD
ncbi:MAG: ABC transporter permease [Propionibacteriaceae bacterium]|jgi:ribose transport system permease protein|nr:ABC transporter permease [Propionibacteriaceae bacterium]